MFGQVIPTSNDATYLGVIFDSRLTWEKQITKISNKSYDNIDFIISINPYPYSYWKTQSTQSYSKLIYEAQSNSYGKALRRNH